MSKIPAENKALQPVEVKATEKKEKKEVLFKFIDSKGVRHEVLATSMEEALKKYNKSK